MKVTMTVHNHSNYPRTHKQYTNTEMNIGSQNFDDANEHNLSIQEHITTPYKGFYSPFATSYTPNLPPKQWHFSKDFNQGTITLDVPNYDLMIPQFGLPNKLVLPLLVSSDEEDNNTSLKEDNEIEKANFNMDYQRTLATLKLRPSSSVHLKKRRILKMRNLHSFCLSSIDTADDTMKRKRKKNKSTLFARIA